MAKSPTRIITARSERIKWKMTRNPSTREEVFIEPKTGERYVIAHPLAVADVEFPLPRIGKAVSLRLVKEKRRGKVPTRPDGRPVDVRKPVRGGANDHAQLYRAVKKFPGLASSARAVAFKGMRDGMTVGEFKAAGYGGTLAYLLGRGILTIKKET